MEDLDYKKKLEDLKQKNVSKIENFKSIYNQIQSNIVSQLLLIYSEMYKVDMFNNKNITFVE